MTNFKKQHKKIMKFFSVCMLVVFLFAQQSTAVFAFWGVGDLTFDGANVATNTKDTIESTAQTGMGIKDIILKFVLDPLAYAIASRIAQKLTERVVNWANEGFDGNPFYIDDVGDFLADAAREEKERFFRELDNSHSPFARTIIKTIDAAASGENVYAEFNLDTVFGSNWEDFDQNFSTGGWDRWSAGYSPAHNAVGAYIQATQDLNTRITDNNSQVQLDLMSNDGFLSMRKCVDKEPANTTAPVGDYITDPDTNENILVVCTKWKTETPGTIIQGRLNQALDQPLAKLNASGKYGQIVSTALNAMISSIVEGGVRELSEAANFELGLLLDNEVANVEIMAEIQSWADNPDQAIDLHKELRGYEITHQLDANGVSVKLANPIQVPGAIALLTEELDVLRQTLDHPDDGLRAIPTLTMQLDHALPGPDKGWTTRLQDALGRSKEYKRAQRKASKGDNDSMIEVMANLNAALATEIPKVQVAMFNPNNNIPNFILYYDQVAQVEQVSANIYGIQTLISNKSKTLAILNLLDNQLTSIDQSDPTGEGQDYTQQYNKLAFQYSRLRDIPTRESLGDTKNSQDEVRKQAQLLRDSLTIVTDAVNVKKNNDSSFRTDYDKKELFVRPLISAMEEADDPASNIDLTEPDKGGIEISDFYTSDITSYLDQTGF